MTDTVAEIKGRLNIQEIIAPYLKLTRAGKSLSGLCPFHKEKTPSFNVSPERGTWHCFGCGLGGDGFSFIEKIEGVDFKGALKILADKAGVPLIFTQGSGGKEERENASKKERVRAVMSRASAWYASKLENSKSENSKSENSPAEEYAKKRGLSKKTIVAWHLGYAPNEWRALLELLTSEGFTIQELLLAGLIKEADGKPGTYYDRFRNRLMFPIRDTLGRVVAFTGRLLEVNNQNTDVKQNTDSKPDADIKSAKYLNSPETELYHKSEILFGMDVAKEAIRVRKFTMLVEGQMDVLHAHQAGFENAVALSGTALSEKHLVLMKRYSENLMLVLDADAAGLSSTSRSAALAIKEGLRVKAARLPKGKDPADLMSSDDGVKEFTKRIAEAKPIVEFLLAELAEGERDPHRLLRSAEGIVLPLIALLPSPMEREHFIQITARALGLSTEAVKESLTRIKQVSSVTNNPNNSNRQYLEQDQVNLSFSTNNTQQTIYKRPADQNKDLIESRRRQLLAVIHSYPHTPLAEKVKIKYNKIMEAKEDLFSEILPESALFEAEKIFGLDPKEDAADDILRAFEESVIREKHAEAVMNLRRAEISSDIAAMAHAQDECIRLSVQLSKI